MPSTLADWDAKYRERAELAPAEPASFVRELLPLLPEGPALDVACGTGRHTLLLASRRQPVTAVDGSTVALEILEARARESHHSFRRSLNAGRIVASKQGIHLVQADLERSNLPANAFSLIVCVQYLQRSLFAQMERALLPDGMLLVETHTRAQLKFEGGPRNPDDLLESGELREAFPGLRVLFYRELSAGKGIASLIARKPSETD